MNQLSWFLYAADVVHSISIFLCLLGVLGLMIGVAFVAGNFYEISRQPKPYIIFISGCVACLFLSVFLPSRITMYAIAASELGEKAIESELGGKALNAVEQWIDSQIKQGK